MTDQIEIPPRGTRGRRITDFFFRLLKPLSASQISRYRKRATAEPPKMGKVPLVLLTTVGARTGRERTSVLGGFEEPDGSWLVVGSKGGSDSNPDWVHNLRANPRAHVDLGTDAFEVTARELPLPERDAAYPKIVARRAAFGEYEAKTSRVIPLFELQRG